MAAVIILRIIRSLVEAVELLVIVRAVGSWIPANGGTWGKIYGYIYALTEPVLAPVRKLLSKIPFFASIPVDFSPIALFLILGLLQNIITNIFIFFIY